MRKILLLGLMMATAMPTAVSAQRGQDHRDHREDNRGGDHRDGNYNRDDNRNVNRNRHANRSRHAYVAPVRGWRYHRVNRGYRLRPVFWGPRYVVDYRTYRLRAPYGYQRWIRYGDDLLLVDTRSGRVMQVIPNRYTYY